MRIAPVLKSNATGHGIREVVEILDGAEGVPFYCVDDVREALLLRNAGCKKDILVIGHIDSADIIAASQNNISITITQRQQIKDFASYTVPLACHISVDTGLHRLGLYPDEARQAIDDVRAHPLLTLAGISTHFTNHSNRQHEQIITWNDFATSVHAWTLKNTVFHAAATPSLPNVTTIYGTVARIGIGLYGYGVQPSYAFNITPALSMHATIIAIRDVDQGEWLGYGQDFYTERRTTVAVVAAGYADGVDMRLSTGGVMYIHDTEVPIIGQVCMNMTFVDISALASRTSVGDQVEVISSNLSRRNSVGAIASLCKTIPQEVFVSIPAEIPRMIVE